MIIKLHRLTGRVFEVEFNDVVSMSKRYDETGFKELGTNIMIIGKKSAIPCKETTEQIAELVRKAKES